MVGNVTRRTILTAIIERHNNCLSDHLFPTGVWETHDKHQKVILRKEYLETFDSYLPSQSNTDSYFIWLPFCSEHVSLLSFLNLLPDA